MGYAQPIRDTQNALSIVTFPNEHIELNLSYPPPANRSLKLPVEIYLEYNSFNLNSPKNYKTKIEQSIVGVYQTQILQN